MDAAGIADGMKNDLSGGLNLLRGRRADYAREIHRSGAADRRYGFQLRGALGFGIGGYFLLAETAEIIRS